VRDVAVMFDGTLIFEGELRRAPGRVVQQVQLQSQDSGGRDDTDEPPPNIIEECSETILFTLEESILGAIALQDPYVALTREGGPGGAVDYIAAACIEEAVVRAQQQRPTTTEAALPAPAPPLRTSWPATSSRAAQWASVASTEPVIATGEKVRPQRSSSAIRRRIRRHESHRQQHEAEKGLGGQSESPATATMDRLTQEQELLGMSLQPAAAARQASAPKTAIKLQHDPLHSSHLPQPQPAGPSSVPAAPSISAEESNQLAAAAVSSLQSAAGSRLVSVIDTADPVAGSTVLSSVVAAAAPHVSQDQQHTASSEVDELAAEIQDLFKVDNTDAVSGNPVIDTNASSHIVAAERELAGAPPATLTAVPEEEAAASPDSLDDDVWEEELRRMMAVDDAAQVVQFAAVRSPHGTSTAQPMATVLSPTKHRRSEAQSATVAPQTAPSSNNAGEGFDEDEQDLLNDLMANRNALMLQPLIQALEQPLDAPSMSAVQGGVLNLDDEVAAMLAGADDVSARNVIEISGSSEMHLPQVSCWGARGREGMVLPLASLPFARDITLCILSTHGDLHYAGLTGLQVWVARPAAGRNGVGRVVEHPLSRRDLCASPPDINVDGHSGDLRTLDKLVDGTNVTTDDVHMWLVPFTAGPRGSSGYYAPSRSSHVLRVRLPEPCWIAGLTIYNYNKSPDDTFRGAKHVALAIGRSWVQHPSSTVAALGGPSPSHSDVFTLRRAPGDTSFDFGQRFHFGLSEGGAGQPLQVRLVAPAAPCLAALPAEPPQIAASQLQLLRQDFEVPPNLPTGHILRLAFSGTWGDPFYQGVDAIALYDAAGVRIPVFPWQVSATPFGIGAAGAAASAASSGGGGEPSPQDARTAANLGYTPPAAGGGGGGSRAGGADLVATAPPDDECSRRRDDPLLYVPVLVAAAAAATPFPPARSWLAPLPAPHHDTGLRTPVTVTFAFDAPVAVSLIRIFNYSKTPARGAAEVEVTLDGVLVFAGELADAPLGGLHTVASLRAAAAASVKQGRGAGQSPTRVLRPCNSIVLSDDRALLLAEAQAGRLHYCGTTEQQVLCFNAGRMAVNVSSAKAVKVEQALQKSLAQPGAMGASVARAGKEAQRPRTAVHVG
jgi:hypothetical protein